MGLVGQGETRLQLRGTCNLFTSLSTFRIFLMLLITLKHSAGKSRIFKVSSDAES